MNDKYIMKDSHGEPWWGKSCFWTSSSLKAEDCEHKLYKCLYTLLIIMSKVHICTICILGQYLTKHLKLSL